MSSTSGGKRRQINGVKVFTATKYREREDLADDINAWLQANPDLEILDKVVTQSSDQAFHCLSVTLFYHDPTYI
ncbi:MAG: hypothetical protein JW797_16300 [Bradymonadales bacterium]|nr:hypothetical protein [Bradymonadales bacterium]